MKLIITAAIAALSVIQVNAASMGWQLITAASENGSSVYALLGSSTSGLVFSSIDQISSNESVLTTKEGNSLLGTISGVAGRTGTVYSSSGTIVNDNLTTSNANFFFVLVNSDKTGYWISSVYDGAAKVYTPPASSPGEFSVNQSASSLTYTSFTPVPEPATGALALAGIALLFKRRKARA